MGVVEGMCEIRLMPTGFTERRQKLLVTNSSKKLGEKSRDKMEGEKKKEENKKDWLKEFLVRRDFWGMFPLPRK